MNKKFWIGLIAVILGAIGVTVVLASENALVFHPRGIIAKEELELIVINLILMWIIIIPTYILLFAVVYKYCIKNVQTEYDPDHTLGTWGQILMWAFPSLIVILLSIVTWERTHHLNPYKPLESNVKPLKVQVVAMDWKWLFIYPDLGIATLNYFQIPEKTPIHLHLSADNAPMNSFWIPQLSGQIYSMAGMTTQLFLMADHAGDYRGRAVEINGEGYADMDFAVKSTTEKDFQAWVAEVKKSSEHLTEEAYNQLIKPEVKKSIILYSEVDNDLYQKIIHKYMYPTHPVL
jgi:cytochrome o ubiquinol oxidase subunit 2